LDDTDQRMVGQRWWLGSCFLFPGAWTLGLEPDGGCRIRSVVIRQPAGCI